MVKAIIAWSKFIEIWIVIFTLKKKWMTFDLSWNKMKLLKSIGMAHEHVYNYFIIKHDTMIHTVLLKDKLELWI
jgi:hypothetical protein